MNEYLLRLICVLIGYVFGCVQFSYILGKIERRIDIRDYGSGNAGTTNALRVLGRRIGFFTLAGDILKAVVALLIIALIWGFDQKWLMVWGGAGVVLGHNHPFYMQFKGGKGVAAMIGIYLTMDLRMLIIAGVPALILLYFTKYMSLASITYMVLLIVTSVIFYWNVPFGLEVIAITAILCITTIIRHRGNIKRLINGTERKVGQKEAAKTDASEESTDK